MYIYELPFEINKELCRLLDNYDYWEELAGEQMKYTAMDVIEIKQTARHLSISPTHQLFTRWGQHNHRVEELFMLLYHMKHVPALRCLSKVVDNRFLGLLYKLESKNGVNDNKRITFDENADKQSTQKVDRQSGTRSSIPLPVILIDQGEHVVQSSSHGNRGNSPTMESSTDTSRNTSSTQNGGKDDADEMMKNVSAIPKMSYRELMEATNNWSESNLLGKGGFGQVFKGEWKHLPVAVKRLRDNDDRNKELIREMCLNQYRHDNILPLYGYSLGGPEACLVYQLMAGGSLEQRLRGRSHFPPLSWLQRYRVAHGVARGLQFLHTMAGTPLIHGDIKPANIMLDQCLIPKIGDFGLARKGPYGEERTHVKVSRIYGTKPYLPDEYLRSHCLSPAVDVFSYGVVMVEMATTLPAVDRSRSNRFLSVYVQALQRDGVDFASLEDPVLRDTANSNPQLCREFVTIGAHCTKYARKERPTMLEVYKRLDAMNFPEKHLY